MLTARKKVLQTVGGRSSVISSRDKPRISRNSEEKKKESQENVESLSQQITTAAMSLAPVILLKRFFSSGAF
jgi:hypothetical protein